MFKAGDRAKVLDPIETVNFAVGDIVEIVNDRLQERQRGDVFRPK